MQKVSLEDRIMDAWDAAHTAMRQGDLKTAKTALWRIIRYDRRNAAAFNRLGIVYAKERKLRRSTAFFTIATRLENSASALHNLGLIYYERQIYKKSRDAFQAALGIENGLAARHIALAKAEEKLGNSKAMVAHLKEAVKIQENKDTKRLYIEALSQLEEGSPLSPEIIDALGYNRIPWQYAAVEEYQEALNDIRSLAAALEQVIHGISKKKLSPRSTHSLELGIMFLHNLRGCLNLLEQNYSHAALAVGRSCVEIYLKCSYASRFKSYRGYAEIEKTALQSRIGANQRLIRSLLPGDRRLARAIILSRKSQRSLHALNKRYPNLQAAPSLRQMSLILDRLATTDHHYKFYTLCYEWGSASTHSDRAAIQRSVRLSGTYQAGLFIDSHKLAMVLRDLCKAFDDIIIELPEVSAHAKKRYHKAVRNF